MNPARRFNPSQPSWTSDSLPEELDVVSDALMRQLFGENLEMLQYDASQDEPPPVEHYSELGTEEFNAGPQD